MKLFIIDNFDSFTWNLYQQFSYCVNELGLVGIKINVIRNNSALLDQINVKETLAIVIGPGPGRPVDSGKSNEIFCKFVGRVPFLGVCLGHQMIAQHYGAKISRAKYPYHGKTSYLKNASGKLFKGIDFKNAKIKVARYHSLIVENNNFPSNLTITSHSEDEEVMSFTNEELAVFGIQFHPESFLTESGDLIVKNFIKAALSNTR